MPFPRRETVYERSKRNGGYITGLDHGIMRRLRVQERQQEAEKRLKAQTEKPQTADAAKEE